MEIGSRLKQLRLANDLTLEELASRCELSKGFLSQLERDLTSPSIATLEDILEALGSTLGEFFASETQEKTVFGKDDFFVDEQEDYTISWIVPNAQKHDMEPILLSLQPGAAPYEMAVHDGEEFGYVLKGTILLKQEGRSWKIRKGETFYVRGRVPHSVENAGSKPAVLLWVATPPAF